MILPVNTFIATAEAVLLCGATPVFVDHDEYFNIDPARIEERIGSRTKAVIAVHLYGQPARMTELKAICDRRRLILFEDAAQAHLARFDSTFVGNWGLATCFSFYPGKNLGAYGEGGAVLTRDAAMAERMRELRDHGSHGKYNHVVAGTNYRMEALQGAVLETKLKHLDGWTALRKGRAAMYLERLASITTVIAPRVHACADPVWHLFVVRVPDRDRLQDYLMRRGVSTGLHYPVPLHRQPAFSTSEEARRSFPNAEVNAGEVLSLPMYPELSESSIDRVCSEIRQFYG